MNRIFGGRVAALPGPVMFFSLFLFCFLSDRALADPGVMDERIVVGMSTALSGHSSFLGTSFRAGVESYLNSVNEKGGVKGRKIQLIVYDDGYDPGRAFPNASKLINEDKVFCLMGNVGTPTTVAIMPLIKEQNVPLFAPYTGAESLRTPLVKNVLHYRASYNQETEELIKGAVDVLNYKRIGVLYQNDSYGKAVLKGVRTALQKRGLEPVIAANYMRNTENIDEALNTIMKDKPQVVVMVGTYAACARFIIEGKKKGFNPLFMNVSFVGPEMLAKMAGAYGDSVVVTQVVPPFQDESKNNRQGVNEYLNALKKYSPGAEPNSVGLEGFLAAKVFVEGLKRSGEKPTRESFIAAVESIKDLDVGAGNKIGFSSQNHQGSQKVYTTVIKNGKFRLVENWNILK